MKLAAKDIPDEEILRFILERSQVPLAPDHWTAQPGRLPRWVWCWDFETGPWAEWPWKVVQAKLNRLIRRGLLDGCTCGCRGDYEMTPRGLALLEGLDAQA